MKKRNNAMLAWIYLSNDMMYTTPLVFVVNKT